MLTSANDKTIGKTLAMVDRTKVFVANPFIRPLEEFEGLPFDEFIF
jgi:hypothetical protein